MTGIKKRFVAGAICPACSKMDKIVTYDDENESYRECVSCGFVEKLSSMMEKAKEKVESIPVNIVTHPVNNIGKKKKDADES